MRMTQRSSGLVSGQTYEDRTCEVVFAGLDDATDIDAVQMFVAQTKIIVYEKKPNSTFKVRVVQLQLVMIAGR